MRVFEALLKDPGDSRDLEQWGVVAGASGQALPWLFVAETGLTFAAWRKRLQLQEAIKRLDAGQQVSASP
jgi:methylphosphotriester-DNA--protein-cysteine methyltransferase